MHHWEPQQFFEPYIPQRYCPNLDQHLSLRDPHSCSADTYQVDRVYSPEIEVRGGHRRGDYESFIAAYGRVRLGEKILEYRLADRDDVDAWKPSNTQPSRTKPRHRATQPFVENLQGRIGDRILHLILCRFAYEFGKQAQNAGYHSGTRVLIEQRKYRAEGHLVKTGDGLVLKFDRHTTLRLFRQKNRVSHRFEYDPDVDFDELCELDGFAYLLAAKERQSYRYRVIGEVKTGKTNHNGWSALANEAVSDSLAPRIFTPLRKLYPGYTFVYLITGYQQALFEENKRDEEPFTVSRNIALLVRNLLRHRVLPMFALIPGHIDCNQLANHFDGVLKFRQAEAQSRREPRIISHVHRPKR